MKRIFTIFLTLFVASSGWAYDFEIDGIYYNIIDDDAVNVYSGKNVSGDVVIPSAVTYAEKNYSVTSIGQSAFSRCSNLTSITIPNSVTSIGQSAFSGCSNLTSITIPNSVTSIEQWAFSDCSNLTSIMIPDGVTSIEQWAFSDCSNLTSIMIPNGVTSIEQRAFQNCHSLTSITIPNSVTSIGSRAFYDCNNLTSITIPNSVTSIEQRAFENCSSLTSITIQNGVTSIGQSAFSGCSNLTSITIPNSVTSIGGWAFQNCHSLTSITIPDGVTSIGSGVFSRCRSLTSITIPNGVTLIRNDAFSGCSSLTSITIPNSVTDIGSKAFSGCSSLTSITIQNGVTSIEQQAFENCSSLTSITIPNSVTDIGNEAFSGCINLSSIMVEAGNMVYDSRNNCNAIIKTSSNRLIAGCQKTIIPNNVVYIYDAAFSACPNLTSIIIPSSVTSIGDNIFTDYDYSGLKITCLASTPPKIGYSDNIYDNLYWYVPCESVDDYKNADGWKYFKHIECLESESVDLTKDEVAVVPEKTEAVFSMPKNENANTYTLTISNNGVTFCSLTFNAQGQLANIDFSTNKSYELKSGVEAFQFTVTGLSTAEDYGYSFKALASNKSVLKEYTGTFTTKNEDGTGGSVQGGGEGSGQGGQGGSTAVSEVSNTTAVTIVNGQILVNSEAPAFVVTISGQKIANANLKAGVYFVVADGNSVSVVVR